MQKETQEELLVRSLLESEGYGVTRIPTTSENRADYNAVLDSEAHLIEVKTIVPSPIEMGGDGVALWSIDLGYRNSVSGVIGHSAKQLLSTPGADAAFRMVWFVLSDADWRAHAEQIKTTLYGAVDLIYEMGGGTAKSKPCYLFTFSEFWRRREIDAVVVSSFSEGRVCLNAWSNRAAAFKESKLWKLHATAGAISDPEVEESAGAAFIADFEGDRRDQQAMLDGVQRKYGHRRLIPFQPTQHQAAAFLRR